MLPASPAASAAVPTTGADDSATAVQPAEPPRASGLLPNSVAVLPLDNLSPDPNNAYVAAGLHEEILNQLAKLRNLNVISRTSVLPYAENRPPIDEIARELNVQSIMEGSIRLAGTRIRVTTQLIDSTTGLHLWSETYEREFDDIFAIESDIAMNVANALEAEFSLTEQQSIEQVPTESTEVYALYLRAQSETGARRYALLDEALRLDPEFAPAHAAKAIGYSSSMINTTGGGAQGDWLELADLARASAERLLEIDPGDGRGYLTLGVVDMFLWRWDEAEPLMTRAVESGGNVPMLWLAAWFYAFSGDYERAIELATRMVELSPIDAGPHMHVGIANEHAGNIEAAIAGHRRSIALNPGNLLARQHLGLLEARVGNIQAAAEQFGFIERFFGDNVQPVYLPELAIGYAMIGLEDDARRLADAVFALAEERDMGAGSLAMANLAVGDTAGAIAQLERAAERVRNNEPDQGFFSLMLIKRNVLALDVLEQPAFQDLREQLEMVAP
jgi:TolB-like protein/Flp pilus assembly protein TadD